MILTILIFCKYKIIILYLLEEEKIWLTVCYNDLDILIFCKYKIISSVYYNDLDNLDIL